MCVCTGREQSSISSLNGNVITYGIKEMLSLTPVLCTEAVIKATVLEAVLLLDVLEHPTLL